MYTIQWLSVTPEKRPQKRPQRIQRVARSGPKERKSMHFTDETRGTKDSPKSTSQNATAVQASPKTCTSRSEDTEERTKSTQKHPPTVQLGRASTVQRVLRKMMSYPTQHILHGHFHKCHPTYLHVGPYLKKPKFLP